MRIAYLDCIGGISGDMFLGALVDLGVESSFIEEKFKEFELENIKLKSEKVLKLGISATKIDFEFDEKIRFKNYKDIVEFLNKKIKENHLKSKVLKIFSTLAEVEAKIHNVLKEEVHFHELGCLDTICDILGVCIALEKLI